MSEALTELKIAAEMADLNIKTAQVVAGILKDHPPPFSFILAATCLRAAEIEMENLKFRLQKCRLEKKVSR